MHERQANDARPGARAPALSVVLPMPRGYDAIRATVRSLEAQSSRDLLELVIVAPSARALDLGQSELTWCRHIRIVDSGTMTSLGAAYAAGVRGATAPVVALAEDHSYPAPEWAKALIERHGEPWGAVGPVVANANPGNAFGDAAYYMGYGRWAGGIPSGDIDDVPGHNSSYKRSILLDHGSELSALLEVETILHWRLRTEGYRLYLEPAARTNHHNPSTLMFLLKQSFHYGRLFAAARAREWPGRRRALYTAASVLIPVVRLWRVGPQVRRTIGAGGLARVLPALIIGLITSAFGEMIGYAWGPGGAKSRLFTLECARDRHVKPVAAPRRSAAG